MIDPVLEEGLLRSEEEQNWVFIGNPGAGKSTIVNGVCGEVVAYAKPSTDGEGVTKGIGVHPFKYGNLIDTPGLADTNIAEQAADAIRTGLQMPGFLRVFFVITEEAGRIRPADQATIKSVLNACPLIGHGLYSIIVNKVKKDWMDELLAQGDWKGHECNLEKWLACLMRPLPRKSTSIHFMPTQRELVRPRSRAEKKAMPLGFMYEPPIDLKEFVLGAPGILAVGCHRVDPISREGIAHDVSDSESEMAKLRVSVDAMRDAVEEQREDLKEATEAADKAKASRGFAKDVVVPIMNAVKEMLGMLIEAVV